MIYFIRTAFIALSFFCSTAAFAGYVKLPNGREVFTDYRPAEAGRPTLVLLSGLTYNLDNWDRYKSELLERDSKIGILRFDMIGMGKTLLRGPLPVNYDIPYKDQVELAKQLMDHYGIRKAFVGGLSYGGGLAVAFATSHPERVEQIILMAPFTEPLGMMDSWIKSEITATRFAFPLNPASDEELYDFFLRQFIYSSYPSLEPVVLENPYKLEAVFRMVQGIRLYDTVKDARNLPRASTHLLVANQDQYIQGEVLERFWRNVPRASRASRIRISVTQHKIPETIPAYAAAWTLEIMNRNPELSRGLDFEGSTFGFDAKAGKITISLKKN